MSEGPQHVRHMRSLAETAEAIAAWCIQHPHPRPIVGITGPVGSGKTTLAQLLSGESEATVVSTDRYLPDYKRVPYEERDDPRHADLDRLSSDLVSLSTQGAATVPVWSFHEHRATASERLHARGLIVCEGIFALHPKVTHLHAMRVFVQAPAATRWARWEAIELSGERGWGVEEAKRHFASVAEPSFDRHASGYRDSADIIVTNDAQPDPPDQDPPQTT